MANILISYFSDYGEAMYDAITDILLKNGNNVFRFNINNPAVTITKWGGESRVNNNDIKKKLTEFNPDIVFNFNNCLPKNCYELLNEQCKICSIDADAPDVAFWNKEAIEKYKNRVFFLGLQSYSKTMYERYLGIKLTDKNYLYFPPATIVKNEKLKQDKNISFIGSNFYPLEVPQNEDFYSKETLALYDALKKDYFLPFETAKKIYPNCSKNLFDSVKWYYCGQERLKYMEQLTDLGLTLYGVREWNRIAYYDFELAKCFDPTPKVTIEENQWVYNTSKISINISHPLAKSSFSWRVMDIMASNSCLLMEDKPDWRDLFEKYLSKDVLNTIIYKDRFDMREKVKKLLADKALRQKCVKELNNAIEKNGRWEIRFAKLEKSLNIKLLNLKKTKGQYIYIQTIEKKYHKKQQIQCRKKSLLERLNMMNRCKMSFYLLCLLYAQIPVLDCFISKRKRCKWKEKLDKYWR